MRDRIPISDGVITAGVEEEEENLMTYRVPFLPVQCLILRKGYR
jgi:hypothetical protein